MIRPFVARPTATDWRVFDASGAEVCRIVPTSPDADTFCQETLERLEARALVLVQLLNTGYCVPKAWSAPQNSADDIYEHGKAGLRGYSE